MSGKNGYVSLDALRSVKRLEDDVEVAGVGKFRVQALSHEEMRLIERRARDKDAASGQDGYVYNQALVAFGLVSPRLCDLAHSELDEALEVVRVLSAPVLIELVAAINRLSFQSPGDAFKSFTNGDASPATEAVTASGTSS